MKYDYDLMKAAVWGFAAGDALGTPVKFRSREEMDSNPVKDMPVRRASYSDDTAMLLCLLNELHSPDLSLYHVTGNLLNWRFEGQFTQDGAACDIGETTEAALQEHLSDLQDGAVPSYHGKQVNDSGSLARILPAAFYLYYGLGIRRIREKNAQALEVVFSLSGITHTHPVSLLACLCYVGVALRLMDGCRIPKSIVCGVKDALKAYRACAEEVEYTWSMPAWKTAVPVRAKSAAGRITSEDKPFEELFDIVIRGTQAHELKNTGNVQDVLYSALWCLYNTYSYRECVLTAVNLGGETDTRAAVAGGLAGLYYGWDAIPVHWRERMEEQADLIITACIHGKYRGEIYFRQEEYQVALLEEEVTIRRYCGSARELRIPAFLCGREVTQIGQEAFLGNRTLEKISIPGTVKVIGHSAFKNCISLLQVTLEEGVRTIKEDAFTGCLSMRQVRLPRTIRYLSFYSFFEYGQQENTMDFVCRDDMLIGNNIVFLRYFGTEERVAVPNGIRCIAGGAFEENDYVKSVWVPKSVCSISRDAFCDCRNLSEIILEGRRTNLEYPVIRNSRYGMNTGCEAYIIWADEKRTLH